MDDYIKQLEEQNEELKKLLAEKQLKDLRENILFKDFVLNYFIEMVKHDSEFEKFKMYEPKVFLKELLLKETSQAIVKAFWGNNPLGLITLRTAEYINESPEMVEFVAFLEQVIDETRIKLQQEN